MIIKIVFFGSFQTYSVQVLKVLHNHFHVVAVVTTPAKPQGRHLSVSPTPVEKFARSHDIRVYPLEQLEAIPNNMPKSDFFVAAGYGKRIPASWLTYPRVMAINVHQSLLPDYRGAFPAEWAILRGEKETGITILKMSPDFDTGEILIQQAVPIGQDDTRETLYKKLYALAGNLLVKHLREIAEGKIHPKSQPQGKFFYARRLTRNDGFVPWNEFYEGLNRNSIALEVKLRALNGWPGVWTTAPNGKRLILVALKPTPVVQLEGKKPISWEQFKSAYLQ